MCRDRNNVWTLVGIVSFSLSNCQGHTGYTLVSQYSDWIQEHIRQIWLKRNNVLIRIAIISFGDENWKYNTGDTLVSQYSEWIQEHIEQVWLKKQCVVKYRNNFLRDENFKYNTGYTFVAHYSNLIQEHIVQNWLERNNVWKLAWLFTFWMTLVKIIQVTSTSLFHVDSGIKCTYLIRYCICYIYFFRIRISFFKQDSMMNIF